MLNPDGIFVEVENFGPIRKGSIDLRPLTVMTGPSNTGKSWFATLFYTLYNRRVDDPFESLRRNLVDSKNSEKIDSSELVEDPQRWIDNLRSHKRIIFNEKELRALERYLAKNNNRLERELCKSFGFTDREQLIRWNSKKGADIRISSINPSRSQQQLKLCLNVHASASNYKVSLPNSVNLSDQRAYVQDRLINLLLDMDGEHSDAVGAMLAHRVSRIVSEGLFGSNGALYIPAGRVGLMDSFRTIVSSSIQGEGDAETQLNQTSRPLSGVLIDFLQNLINISPERRQKDTSDFASKIENKILKGKIDVDLNQLNFPYFSFSPNRLKKKIPLNVTSSMVSQLAPIVLFLRYLSGRNRIIILEEPEVHLHPKMQVNLVDEIAELIKNGYKVVITTHSEVIVAALSNHVITAENLNTGWLHPKNVGFWRFDASTDNEGTVVEEVKWDLDEGGYDHRFDRVSIEMLNVWLKEREKTA